MLTKSYNLVQYTNYVFLMKLINMSMNVTRPARPVRPVYSVAPVQALRFEIEFEHVLWTCTVCSPENKFNMCCSTHPPNKIHKVCVGMKCVYEKQLIML